MGFEKYRYFMHLPWLYKYHIIIILSKTHYYVINWRNNAMAMCIIKQRFITQISHSQSSDGSMDRVYCEVWHLNFRKIRRLFGGTRSSRYFCTVASRENRSDDVRASRWINHKLRRGCVAANDRNVQFTGQFIACAHSGTSGRDLTMRFVYSAIYELPV